MAWRDDGRHAFGGGRADEDEAAVSRRNARSLADDAASRRMYEKARVLGTPSALQTRPMSAWTVLARTAGETPAPGKSPPRLRRRQDSARRAAGGAGSAQVAAPPPPAAQRAGTHCTDGSVLGSNACVATAVFNGGCAWATLLPRPT